MPLASKKIQVTNEDIVYAKKILLGKKESFDIQKKDFIKNLNTIDLQAVPGSGKTLALLAKLLIIEKYMPFDDGTGVLVISHTNAAVDEIIRKIGAHCPKLFAYPNFVGTIQSFVDQFLAIPYYLNIFHKKPYRIDNEIYEEKIKKFNSHFFKGFTHDDSNRAKYYLNSNPTLLLNYRFEIRNGNTILVSTLNGKKIEVNKPRGRTRPQNYNDYSLDEKNRVKDWLFKLKGCLLTDGILHFDDAYYLAEKYIQTFPRIKKILQKRFKYVFVDEMQDMDKHQHDLLEKLFYKKCICRHVYQRIGDKNQSIYSGQIKLEDIWNERPKVLKLTGSYRLTAETASVVRYFGLKYEEIEGKRILDAALKPCIIIFNENTIQDVIPLFVQLIKDKNLPVDQNRPFVAIGWRKEHDDCDKYGIKDYCPQFEVNKHQPTIDYPGLKSYLIFFDRSKSLAEIRKNIINAFLRILRIQQVYGENGKLFTRDKFFGLIKGDFPKFYDEFNLKLYQWCLGIYKGNIDGILAEIKVYIPVLLNHVFNKDSLNEETLAFINNEDECYEQDAQCDLNDYSEANVCLYDGVPIKISTVHSIKGQTNTATLYLETFYQREYESSRLGRCFNCCQHDFSLNENRDIYKKESIKMAYVGFSRPTHLLCFAVHKDRFDRYLHETREDSNWVIIDDLIR